MIYVAVWYACRKILRAVGTPVDQSPVARWAARGICRPYLRGA